MSVQLISQDLVSLEYRDQLQRDLAGASICRFLVGYVSEEGLNSLHRHLVLRALRDSRSFGVASLTCACGYAPLVGLQRELGDAVGIRLKYFMDPVVEGADEPSQIALFHSKLVYLADERQGKAVIYIGSHNWSKRAMGAGGPRNVEASLRLEVDFLPDDLHGSTGSLAGGVNRHLLHAYDLPACLPALPANEPRFQQWRQLACMRAPPAPVAPVTVMLAVRKDDGSPADPASWAKLVDRGIYFQALDEDEGRRSWDARDAILLLVWKTAGDLTAGTQPVILRCRETTHKAGPASQLRGTNRSTDPIEGFAAVPFDAAQLAAAKQSRAAGSSTTGIWSGRTVEFFDFEFPTTRTQSSQVDAGVEPRYQFYLQVESVVLPDDGELPPDPNLVWPRETFAVAQSRDSARYETVPGYEVPAEARREIMHCLSDTLFVDPEKAKVLPVSDFDRQKVGKRLSAHPLHETFFGEAECRNREQVYAKADPAMLVADLDAVVPQGRFDDERVTDVRRAEAVKRIQRVYTTPVAELEKVWADAARRHRNKQAESHPPEVDRRDGERRTEERR